MGFMEDFYIKVAQYAIDYNNELYERHQINKDKYGMNDQELVRKLELSLGGISGFIDSFLEASIEELEGSSIDELEECIKRECGVAIGTIQSYVPTFVEMNARLCERDFGCDYSGLVQQGMVVSYAINQLHTKLTGGYELIPPFPVPSIIIAENVLDVYYQTDILFFMDFLRSITGYEIDLDCVKDKIGIVMDNNEMTQILMALTETISQLPMQYGNIVNMLSRRPYLKNHDWEVITLTILEADEKLYSDGAFFNVSSGGGIVEGLPENAFVNCMIAQSKKAGPFLDRLREILES